MKLRAVLISALHKASGHLQVRPALVPDKELPVPIPLESRSGRRGEQIICAPVGNRTLIPRSISLYPTHYTDCSISLTGTFYVIVRIYNYYHYKNQDVSGWIILK
jgi:hypothetical protein